MDFDELGFASNYDVRLLDHALALGPDWSFELAREPAERGRLSFESQPGGAKARLLEVMTAEGKVWTGSFEAGPGGLTGYFATPSPNTLLVVVQGQAYWIPTLQPASYEIVPAVPIRRVLRVPDRDIVLFIDFVRISAYGPDGLLWRTNDLSWDGLQITEANARSIRGLGWDSPGNRHVEFSVDTSTGVATGGSSPRVYSTGEGRGGG
jgi:hypothetical protein